MTLKYFTQPTPNPNALKFILNRDVIVHGRIDYKSAEDCFNNPFAASLFTLKEITQIHFFENVITVTQNGFADWNELETAVIELLKAGIGDHNPEFQPRPDKEDLQRDMSQEMLEIDEILEETIRPGLQADGGDLRLIDYETDTKVLTVEYEGACNTCPSASVGTLAAIRGVLQSKFDPDIEVNINE